MQRELNTLRHQLKLKSDLNPDTYKSATSTTRKLTSYNATQSSVQTAAENNHTLSIRATSGERLAPQPSVSLRHTDPMPTAHFAVKPQEEPAWNEELKPVNAMELPLKRRFPSQEPTLYSCNENRNGGDTLVPSLPVIRNQYHAVNHSDMPLQMPNLTDRKAEKMRPSMYGGVMSGPGAFVTTAGSLFDQHQQRNLHSARHQRPPTYQTSQSAITRSGSALNTTSFNPLPNI